MAVISHEVLKRRKDELGWTNKYLAEVSGLSQHTVMRILKGQYKPPNKTLLVLAKVLGLCPFYLAGQKFEFEYTDNYDLWFKLSLAKRDLLKQQWNFFERIPKRVAIAITRLMKLKEEPRKFIVQLMTNQNISVNTIISSDISLKQDPLPSIYEVENVNTTYSICEMFDFMPNEYDCDYERMRKSVDDFRKSIELSQSSDDAWEARLLMLIEMNHETFTVLKALSLYQYDSATYNRTLELFSNEWIPSVYESVNIFDNMKINERKKYTVEASVDDRDNKMLYDCFVISSDREVEGNYVFEVGESEYANHEDAIENELAILLELEDIFEVDWNINLEFITNIKVELNAIVMSSPGENGFEDYIEYKGYWSRSGGTSPGEDIDCTRFNDGETHIDYIKQKLRDQEIVFTHNYSVDMEKSTYDIHVTEYKRCYNCKTVEQTENPWYLAPYWKFDKDVTQDEIDEAKDNVDVWICSECNEIILSGNGK